MVWKIIWLASRCAATRCKSRDVCLRRSSFLQPRGPVEDDGNGRRYGLSPDGVFRARNQKALSVRRNSERLIRRPVSRVGKKGVEKDGWIPIFESRAGGVNLHGNYVSR